MKLYTYDAAPNAGRLKLFLDYKGIELDTVQQVDLGTQEQLGDAYLAINPWGYSGFELPKAVLLRALVLIMGLATLVQLIEGRGRRLGGRGRCGSVSALNGDD